MPRVTISSFIHLVTCIQIILIGVNILKIRSIGNNPTILKEKIAGETLDISGEYRILRFYRYLGVNEDYTYKETTIATQCSVNHLHHLIELLDRWDGPVSCSVFAPNIDASYANEAITHLRNCFPRIQKHVTFHLVYPVSNPADFSQKGSWNHLSCEDLSETLENYGQQNYNIRGGIPFPHNVLRNAARSGVMTHFVLLVDIDVMPNVGLRSQFQDFAKRNQLYDKNTSQLNAYVLPVFEVKSDLQFPKNKRELLTEVFKGTVRPFHNETCWWCHKTEDFERWKFVKTRSSEINVAFEAVWDKSWEPFYIAHRSVPLFDERFKQYGFDRIQQICEMHVAGYRFHVMDTGFLTHHGWKYTGKFYAKKDSDNAQNWILFNYHFKDELQTKYKSNVTCSPLEDTADMDRGFEKEFKQAGRSLVSNRIASRIRDQ